MEGLACSSCNRSTPKGGTTVVGSRRIVVKPDGEPETVRSAESVTQTCSVCAEQAKSEVLTINCFLPPFLDIEYTTTMQYLRRVGDRKKSLDQCRLPNCCSLCRTTLPSGESFVEISIGSERYVWRPKPLPYGQELPTYTKSGTVPHSNLRWEQLVECANRLVFAKICSSCSIDIWDVDMCAGYFRAGTPCITAGCPVCAQRRNNVKP